MSTIHTSTDRATPEAAAPHPTRPEAAIAVDGLGIGYVSRGQLVPTVHDVSFTVGPGATTALVGESGSGKTTLASAISGLLPDNARWLTGQVRLHGRDVSRLDEHAWQHVRGRVLGYVPQDPLGSLDPLQTVGDHLVEAVRQARGGTVEDARRAAHDLLETVHIADAAQKFRAYPHELSGGQLQRVLIAGALAGSPGILIADEPTSALDVTVQKRVLDLLDELREELTLSVLLITHDLSLAAERSDRVVVLQHGRTVEEGAARQIIDSPAAAYTRQLFQEVPALTPHKYACPQEDLLATRGAAPKRPPAIAVTGLRKSFGGDTPALDDVTLQVRRGEIHALVGESGSGKTTLARIVAGLVPYDAGTVSVNGAERAPDPEVVNPDPSALQLIYQNPLAALDPRWRLLDLVAEPLRIGGTRRREARRRAGEMLTRVGLPAQTLTRRIGQLSGGQRQRVAIARALVLSPSILVLDEPTSALDVTVQSRIIDLLFDLRAERPELTLVFISHDLSLIRQIADSVTVLRRGQVIEQGPVAEVFDATRQEYTRELLEAIPAAP